MIPRAALSPSTGKVNTTTSATLPTASIAGFQIDVTLSIPMVAFASLVAPTSRIGGFQFDANGALVVTNAGSQALPVSYQGGLPFCANGCLIISAGPAVSYQDGVGFDANGFVVVTTLAGGGAAPALIFNTAPNSQYYALYSVGGL